MVDLYHFTGLIFTDAHTHANYVLYNRAYFACLIFAVRRSSVKTLKIGPLENILLYGIPITDFMCVYAVIVHTCTFMCTCCQKYVIAGFFIFIKCAYTSAKLLRQ